MPDPEFNPKPKRDLVSLTDDYQRRSSRAAADFDAAAKLVLARIGEFPGLFSLHEESDLYRAAQIGKFPHLFLYRIIDGLPRVVAVVPARASFATWRRLIDDPDSLA